MKRLTLNSASALAIGFALAFASMSTNAQSTPQKRTVIHSQRELPSYSYKITTPTVSALLDNDAALLVLADAVRKDAEATLENYDITDKATLRDLYGAIRDAALIRGDAKAALANSAKVREMADKPAEKLTSGLRGDAAAAAMAAGVDPQQRKAAFQKAFAASIDPLPWAVVRDDVIAWNGQFEIPNMGTVMRSGAEARVDPILKKSGKISWDAARAMLSVAIYLRRIEPYLAQATGVLSGYIKANKHVKPDIWAARKVALDADGDKLTPVVIAIWDGGVDTSLFPGRLFTNKAEKVDDKDDDGNGFIDDVHGIAFDENDNSATQSLVSFDSKYPGREAELRELNVGREDMLSGVDSPAAKVVRDRASTLAPDQIAPLMEAAEFYGTYAHGTHVAGIAMDANPAARLMVIRSSSSGYKTKPPAYTPERATRWAANARTIVSYMKAHGVKVVNMSWSEQLGDIDKTLEANGIGKSADDRRKVALESFKIDTDALTQAFRDAPQILFVASAGNANNDVGFSQRVPAGIDLPNVLTVGAVDQAGDEAWFTSEGQRVRVHADGFQVESTVPGGTKMRMSGTSMAAPQVTNLAAKLFAMNPQLSPTEVIKLIVDGATKSADGKRLLINPKASVALLETKH